MKLRTGKLAKGFSLIEVMIALVILAIGILGISKLQATLIKNSSNANQRAVAVSIAQKKIDDLRSFVALTSTDTWSVASGATASNLNAASLAYSHIQNNTGGAPASTVGLIEQEDVIAGNYTYALNWTVTDYWHGTSVASTPTTTAPSVGALADEKLVAITVAWTDELGFPQSVGLSTIIDAYSPSFTALSGQTAPGGSGPEIEYTPLAAPDVVPVTLDIGDKKKESSKPVPDLSKKGNSTAVQFETITYTPNGATTTAVRKEEFLTAVCKCKNGTNTSSIEKGFFEWDAENMIVQDITSTVPVTPANYSATTVDAAGGDTPHFSCETCCRDAADITGIDFKACRMKRIDGIYRIYEPWGMISFNIIPSSYFNEGTGASGATASNSLPDMGVATQASNISLYSEYVKLVVRNALSTIQATSAIPATIDTSFDVYVNGASTVANFVNIIGASTVDHKVFTVGGDAREYQVRSVYLDIPPDEIYEGGIYAPFAAVGISEVPLDRIPFFENNFTQVAGWTPDKDDLSFTSTYTTLHDAVGAKPGCAKATGPSIRNYVTNDEIEFGCESLISRGVFNPIVAASVIPQTVSAVMFTSNDGVIDQLVNTGAASVVKSINLTVE